MASGTSHANLNYHEIILFLIDATERCVCDTAGFVQAVRQFDPMGFRTSDHTVAPPTDLKSLQIFGVSDKAHNGGTE